MSKRTKKVVKLANDAVFTIERAMKEASVIEQDKEFTPEAKYHRIAILYEETLVQIRDDCRARIKS